MNSPAVVIAVSQWPASGSGGPAGFAYLLLKSLLVQLDHDFDYYLLVTGCRRIVRLRSVEELERLVVHSIKMKTTLIGQLRQIAVKRLPLSPCRPIRNCVTLIRQWRARKDELHIYKLLEDLCRRHSSIICHAHSPVVTAKLVEACRLLNSIRIIHTEHTKGGAEREYCQLVRCTEAPDRAQTWIRSQYAAAFLNARTITFPSDGAVALFEENSPLPLDSVRKRVLVIRSGISIDDEPKSAHTVGRLRPTVFAIAQHVPEKGIDRMLHAVKACHSAGVPLVLRIAGAETVLSPSLYRLRDELNLREHIVFLGAVPHPKIVQELRECDLYLACPRVVVFDLSLLEAMASGTPIITSRLPGNVEALGEDYTGYFESDSELPALMQLFLRNPQMAETLGNANRTRCKAEFSLNRMAERYRELYNSTFAQ